MKRQKQRPSQPPTLPRTPRQNSGVSSWQTWLCGLLLVVIVGAAYLRACRGEFIWDDDANITKNVPLRSLAGLAQIWFQPGATQQYYPLTHTSFWLDYHAWGLHPLAYHLENILLHAVSAVLLWTLLRRLAVPGAWLGAALFALHPVDVESVAWITERKNTLAGFFFLGSLLAAVRFWLLDNSVAKEPANAARTNFGPWKYYGFALGLYVCALWSKTATIGLPAVIALLIWWKRKKTGWRDVALLAPFVVAGVGAGLITMWVEKHHLGASGKEWEFSVAERCWLAGRIFWFYLGKLAWPHPLMFVYPRWVIDIANPLAWLPVLALVAALGIFWWKRAGWGRPILVAAGYFIVMLFPVLGFFDVFFFRFSFVCDHFQYLASMGPLALAGAGITLGLGRFRNRFTLLLPAVLLLALGALTWRQTASYHDRETLWRDSVAQNPDAWMAHNNLGYVLLQTGRTDEAITHFKRALEIKPGNAEAHNNLGGILLKLGNVGDATTEFQAALAIQPDYAAARANLGAAMLQSGRVDEAIRDYDMALQITPDDLAAHVNIGDALFHQGRIAEAAAHYEKAIELARASGREKLAEDLSTELNRQKAEHAARSQ